MSAPAAATRRQARSAPGASFPELHWYRHSWLSRALVPLAAMFGAVVAARRSAFRLGVARTHRIAVPVVVVGNLVVGGTGKTPLVIWLVEALRARGFHPGIVSRGYGGATVAPAPVVPSADAARCGDEPLLLAERTAAPVFVGRDRVAAARALLAAHPAVNVIVSDDGLQHYRLGRDVELAVEDERGHGNGLLLPAGPLREPASRRVDATIVNGAERPGTFLMRLEPAGFFRVGADGSEVPGELLQRKRLHAVAGIGYPERFFATLRRMGLRAIEHPFPDHHAFAARDLAFPDCDAVLMTEKDAVKCRRFARALEPTLLVALRVAAQVDARLADLVAGRCAGSPLKRAG